MAIGPSSKSTNNPPKNVTQILMHTQNYAYIMTWDSSHMVAMTTVKCTMFEREKGWAMVVDLQHILRGRTKTTQILFTDEWLVIITYRILLSWRKPLLDADHHTSCHLLQDNLAMCCLSHQQLDQDYCHLVLWWRKMHALLSGEDNISLLYW